MLGVWHDLLDVWHVLLGVWHTMLGVWHTKLGVWLRCWGNPHLVSHPTSPPQIGLGVLILKTSSKQDCAAAGPMHLG